MYLSYLRIDNDCQVYSIIITFAKIGIITNLPQLGYLKATSAYLSVSKQIGTGSTDGGLIYKQSSTM